MWEVPPPYDLDEEWKLHREGRLHPDDPKFTYMQGKWTHNPEEWIKTRHAVWEILEGMR
jgi:hypothetical protein